MLSQINRIIANRIASLRVVVEYLATQYPNGVAESSEWSTKNLANAFDSVGFSADDIEKLRGFVRSFGDELE